jgi:carboxypeptidase PM20D1
VNTHMRRLKRLLLRLFLFGIVILAGVMTINTLSFSSKQIPVEAVELPPFPKGAPARLAQAVQFPTVSRDNHIDTLAFLRLDTFLRTAYPLVDSMLEMQLVNGFSRLYKWPGQKAKLPPILLMGHLDVVPVESPDWAEEPFGGVVKDDFIWGRGTLDDKASCLGLLEAAEQLLRENYTPGRTVYFAFGHDEEVSGLQGAKAIARRLAKQGVEFDFVLDEGQLIINDAMDGLNRPLALIGIAEKGYVTLELIAELEEGGHSSMPPPETAVGILSKAVVTLQENPFPADINGPTGAMLRHVGPEMTLPYKVLFANTWLTGGLLRRVLASDPAAAALIRTTTAPTIIEGGVKDNVLPTSASATVNFRILPGETVESVQRYVDRTIDDTRVRVEVKNPDAAQNPSPVSETSAFGFQVIQRTIQEVFPEAVVAPSLVIGATDSRHFTGFSNHIYRFLPLQLEHADLSRIHGIDERVGVENYERAVRFYRRLIENSCK